MRLKEAASARQDARLALPSSRLFRRLAYGWETGILNASGECWPPFVKFPLTLSSDFLLQMDLRRNRLDGSLTRPQPPPNPDKYEENTVRDAISAARAAADPAARRR